MLRRGIHVPLRRLQRVDMMENVNLSHRSFLVRIAASRQHY